MIAEKPQLDKVKLSSLEKMIKQVKKEIGDEKLIDFVTSLGVSLEKESIN